MLHPSRGLTPPPQLERTLASQRCAATQPGSAALPCPFQHRSPPGQAARSGAFLPPLAAGPPAATPLLGLHQQPPATPACCTVQPRRGPRPYTAHLDQGQPLRHADIILRTRPRPVQQQIPHPSRPPLRRRPSAWALQARLGGKGAAPPSPAHRHPAGPAAPRPPRPPRRLPPRGAPHRSSMQPPASPHALRARGAAQGRRRSALRSASQPETARCRWGRGAREWPTSRAAPMALAAAPMVLRSAHGALKQSRPPSNHRSGASALQDGWLGGLLPPRRLMSAPGQECCTHSMRGQHECSQPSKTRARTGPRFRR
jgi:hypothetical protein